MPRSPFRSNPRCRRAALLGATMLASVAVPIGAGAAQLPVVVQQVADPAVAGLQIPATAPSQGMWSAVQPWPLNAVSLVLMPNGKVASYGTPVNNPSVQYGMVYDVWDPTQGYGGGSHTQLSGVAGVNSFCSAQAFQPDGSLLISGGIFDSGTDKGSAVLNSTASGITALTAKLADDRYYATMITRPDGTQLIMGGSYPYLGGAADPQGSIDKGYMTGMTPETYSPLTGWTSLFGATSRDAFGPDNQRWWYPRAWVAPNGKIFGISADRMWYLDPTGAGSVTWAPFKAPQAAASVATAAPNVGPTSTAVMYDVGKILQVGGNSYDNFWGFLASSVATTVDINGTNPAVADTTPMNFGRSWANATVLPTGKVFVEGGSLFDNQADAQAVLAPETWNPATGQWTVGPSASLYRGYHSSAVLMQDGTVLVAGGGAPGPVNNQNVEVYYPPYMFTTVNGQASLAPRPQIVSLSTNRLLYGQSMQVEVTSASALAQVVLIGLSQTTHSFNTGQRRYPMAFSQAGAIVTAQTPASGALAPPGYYQVVAIDANGVPSPGAIVAIGSSVAPPATTATPAAPVSTSLNGMTQCAVENATCSFTGTQKVLFGANGTFASMTATNTLSCSNGTFGGDPVPGIVKACYVPVSSTAAGTGAGNGSTTASASSSASASTSTSTSTSTGAGTTGPSSGVSSGTSLGGMSQCAVENATCSFTGTQKVLFGANGTYASMTATGTLFCSNGAFGRDPVPGIVKACYVPVSSVVAASAPSAPPSTGAWTGIDTNGARVAAGIDGTIVIANSSDNSVWQYMSDYSWRKLPSSMKYVAVRNANSIWGIGLDNNIYRFDGSAWTLVGYNASTVSVSADGMVAVTNPSNEIWYKTTDDTQNAWTKIPNWQARRVAVMNAHSLWIVGLDNNVYRTDMYNNWANVGSAAAEIATSADGTVLITSVNDQQIWRKTGDNSANAWTGMQWKGLSVAAGQAGRLYSVGMDHNIYRY